MSFLPTVKRASRLRMLMVAGLALAAGTHPVSALKIEIDYSYDTNHFFTDNPAAKTALLAAAHDLEALISTSLTGVTQHLFSASSGGRTLNIDWTFSLQQPTSNAPVVLSQPDAGSHAIAADTIIFYAGARALAGDPLGGSAPISATGTLQSIPASPQPTDATVQSAVAASNAVMARGDGPIMASVSGQLGAGSKYEIRSGIFGGSLWFDGDTNNDNVFDTPDKVQSYWHLNSATPVAAGKYDFYTVALQLMLTDIGFGTSYTWLSKVDGTTWKGSEAAALFGTGEGLLTADGKVNPDLFTARLSDGVEQRSLMASGLSTGERRGFTFYDVALLHDINFTTIPEPNSAALLAAGALIFAQRRHRRLQRYCSET